MQEPTKQLSGDKQFATLQKVISRALKFATSEEMASTSQEGLLIRADRLLQLWGKFNEKFLELVKTADQEELGILEEKMEQMENEYFMATELFKKGIGSKNRVQEAPLVNETSQVPISVNVSLPVQQHDLKNTWGEFDGSLLKWIGFRDRFMAAIHNNEKISSAYKYSYLRKSLVGKAAKALGESQLTEDSYQEAWNRIIQKNHTQSVWNTGTNFIDCLY